MAHPTPNQGLYAEVSSDAARILDFTRSTLEAQVVKANVILPILLKCARRQHNRDLSDHLWVVIYTGEYTNPTILFIAACTNGYMGKYPLFLFTPIPYELLHTLPNIVIPALSLMVQKLRMWGDHRRRVYSVFGPEIIAEQFANLWTQYTGIAQVEEPYYHAKISYATAQTVQACHIDLPMFPNERIQIRPATSEDTHDIASLTYGFARESPPFFLTSEQAYREAEILINKKEIWVYYVQQGHSSWRIASIVAFSRNTERMATITKVYTDPNFRGQRRAERLVREVCQHLLSSGRRSVVTLFVGIGNKAANVYRRVGFVGLETNSPVIEGIDPWIEIGFNPEVVDLGHW